MKFVEKYKQYQVEPATIGCKELMGDNYKYVFPNGYGASVIRHKGSYGYEDGLFELAVLIKVTEDDYDLCYTTPITHNVIGWLSDENVCEKLEEIKKLKEVTMPEIEEMKRLTDELCKICDDFIKKIKENKDE